MNQIPRLGADAAVEELTSHLVTHGCVVVEELVASSLRRRIDDDLFTLLEGVGTNNNEFSGTSTKRFNGILSAVPATQQLALHPMVTGAVEAMLLAHCAQYQLNYDGIMQLLPGETAQPIHRDGGLYPFRNPSPAYTIATMWAQTDFTEDNGATCLIPGSHLWDDDRKPEAEEAISAVMPAGSVLIYTGGVYHGAGANRSNLPRTGVSLQYNLAWLRQELNMFLTYPPEVARGFPDALQRLIGYDFGGPYLGFINEGNPQQLLRDEQPSALRERSTPELDEASMRITRVTFER